MKKLHVGLGTAEDFFTQGKRIACAADRGEPISETFSVTFEDPEVLAQLLTRGFQGGEGRARVDHGNRNPVESRPQCS